MNLFKKKMFEKTLKKNNRPHFNQVEMSEKNFLLQF